VLPGMVGCYLSHLNIYKTVAEGTKPYGVIFEDDAEIDPQIYDKTIRHLNTTIPSDWDVILLGYFDYDKTHEFVQLDTCKRALNLGGNHGYIVNRASAQKLHTLLKPPISGQIDHVMCRLSKEDKVMMYAVNKQVVWQNAQYTDVQPST
jgi:GR25 family glycosyltransferase involved in LPS biosynthesis